MSWTDEQQQAMAPTDGDVARAMALVAGMAAADTDMIDESMLESMQAGRMAQMMLAAGELLVRAHDLRDNQDALADWRIALASHRAAAHNNESE